ncbi:AraC family transcriptional regulator [uncultured Shimia sp.]|uniref:AraC family transcriptional regulator n=1 Tax=uncultured Shimia sp. TaxID=573152 RepID=UPI0025DCD7E0|nr:AraC family transcriptional regulator [uncultured Shimia sp.]
MSEALQRKLGAQVADQLLRKVGRFPGTKTLASVAQEAALVRAACLESGDPTLGAKIGIGYRDAPTLSSYIAASSKTLREAVEGAAKFYTLADPTTVFRLDALGDGEALTVSSKDAGLQANERFQEFLVFGALARIQSITRRETRPTQVMFRHKALGEGRAYESIAGCAVRFGGAFNGLQFAAGVPDIRLETHDPALVSHLHSLAEAQLTALDGGAVRVRDRVERLLVEALPERFLSADEIAAQFRVTRRTLARKLRAEGLSFRALCNDLRYRLAKAHLQDGRSVTETTFLLGYGDQATFSTAFKGWSGVAPSVFVAGHHGSDGG